MGECDSQGKIVYHYRVFYSFAPLHAIPEDLNLLSHFTVPISWVIHLGVELFLLGMNEAGEVVLGANDAAAEVIRKMLLRSVLNGIFNSQRRN